MKCTLKSILLFLTISLFFSCQIQQNIVGKYTVIQREKYPKIIPITFYVELNSDSTFSYKFSGGYHKMVSTGLWKVNKENKKQIIITSFIQDIRKIPIIVKETKNKDNLFPLFFFDNPLKSDTTIKWTLTLNDTDYPLKSDSLVLDRGTSFQDFQLKGYITHADSTYILPFLLQDTIQSENFKIKNFNNNLYHIAFPEFVDYDIFHYQSLMDSMKLSRKTLIFKGTKLRKK